MHLKSWMCTGILHVQNRVLGGVCCTVLIIIIGMISAAHRHVEEPRVLLVGESAPCWTWPVTAMPKIFEDRPAKPAVLS